MWCVFLFRHCISFDSECIRNWVIEGSNDTTSGANGSWTLLRQDETINRKGASATFDIEPSLVQGRSFSKFRIRQTGVNSNSHHYLACSGFEIYGTVGMY